MRARTREARMADSSNVTILRARYVERDQVRSAGGRWDADAKHWYAPEGADLAALAKWIPQPKAQWVAKALNLSTVQFFIDIPFEEKDAMKAAKAAGAKWDPIRKSWAAVEGSDLDALARWKVQKPELNIVAGGDSLEEAGRKAGLELDWPIMDGKIHRVRLIDGKRGAKDGAYVGYDDGDVPRAVIWNHVAGLRMDWCAGRADRNSMKPSHRAAWAAELDLSRARREADQVADQEMAAMKAGADWESYAPFTGRHAYLERKGVEGNGARLDRQGNLVYDIRDIDGKITTLQRIPAEDGAKKLFEKNGKKMGSFHLMGEIQPGSAILLAEGIATGATLRQATGLPVVVALDAGNLMPVAKAIAQRYPDSMLAIMADNDRFGQVNTGIAKGTEAAAAVRGAIAAPAFPDGLPGKPTDWNDLACALGMDEVFNQASCAIKSERARLRAERLAEFKQARPDLEVDSGDPIHAESIGRPTSIGSGFIALIGEDGRASIHEARRIRSELSPGDLVRLEYGRAGYAKAEPAAQSMARRGVVASM